MDKRRGRPIGSTNKAKKNETDEKDFSTTMFLPKKRYNLVVKLNASVKDITKAFRQKKGLPLEEQKQNNHNSEWHVPIAKPKKQRNPDINVTESGEIVKIKKSDSEKDLLLRTPERVPEIFDPNNPNNWPRSCHIRCQNCTLYFDTLPLLRPDYIDDKGVFYGPVVFCSGACVLQDILSDSILHNKTEVISNLYYLMKLILKEYCPEEIIPAPKRSCLIEYNGTMSREEYKEAIKSTSSVYIYDLPPMNAQVTQVIKVSANYATPLDFQHRFVSSGVNNLGELVGGSQLRIRRKKPMGLDAKLRAVLISKTM